MRRSPLAGAAVLLLAAGGCGDIFEKDELAGEIDVRNLSDVSCTADTSGGFVCTLGLSVDVSGVPDSAIGSAVVEANASDGTLGETSASTPFHGNSPHALGLVFTPNTCEPDSVTIDLLLRVWPPLYAMEEGRRSVDVVCP